MNTITIPYKPRELQQQVHKNLKRFNVLVCHRRFGKTVLTVNELIKRVYNVNYHDHDIIISHRHTAWQKE